MIHDDIHFDGRVRLVLTDAQGMVKDIREAKNQITTLGKEFLCTRAYSNTPTPMSHMGIGDTNTAVSPGHLDLQAPTNKIRSNTGFNTSSIQFSTSNDTIRYVCTFSPGVGTWGSTEAGIFNGASGQTMLSRVIFAVINKAAGDTLQITWDIRSAAS